MPTGLDDDALITGRTYEILDSAGNYSFCNVHGDGCRRLVSRP